MKHHTIIFSIFSKFFKSFNVFWSLFRKEPPPWTGSGSGRCRRIPTLQGFAAIGQTAWPTRFPATGWHRRCSTLGRTAPPRLPRPSASIWRSAFTCAGCGGRSARARSVSFGPGSASRRAGSAAFSAIATSSASRRRKSSPAPRAPWCRRRRCCCGAIISACMGGGIWPAPTTAAPPWPSPAPSPPRHRATCRRPRISSRCDRGRYGRAASIF